MYDCAVIGAGAAGVSAALTLKALNRNFIWFGSLSLSEKIQRAENIRNYPGLSAVSGADLQRAFLRQIEEEKIVITQKKVTGVYPAGKAFSVLCGNDLFEAKTVILATGVESVKPVKGELEFLGRGVSYCAVCDGALYRGKRIAVVCTSKEEEQEIEFLASFAEKVYLFALYKNVRIVAENVELMRGFPTEIAGNGRVEKIIYAGGELATDGVFLLKAAIAPAMLVSGLNTENGHVTVNRACETNLKGVFAAGDCTGRPYQYVKAAGEGNVAAHSANAFLNG